MAALDRLSAVIDRFALTVTPAPSGAANLVLAAGPAPGAVRLALDLSAAGVAEEAGAAALFRAAVDWGGALNPLYSALPARLERVVAPEDELAAVARMLAAEAAANRCGAASVLNRLGEILMVRILREALERGGTEPGVLAGLADPRLGRAIVAMHEHPERLWRLDDLAEIAGLSRSRFAELFSSAVGEGPLAYLRRWRLALARQDLSRGERVQTVARRYGYRSGEALNRAFHRGHGQSPSAARRAAAGEAGA